MALGFADAGADLIIASRKLDACRSVAREVEVRGRRAAALAVNVSHWEELDRLVDDAYAAFGRVDVLVNNAGMSPLYPDLTDVSEALWDKVLGVNLKGPFRLTALVGPRMVESGRGSIINISTTGSIRPAPFMLPYDAAKAGLNALTVGFAHAYGPDGPSQLHHGRSLPDRRDRPLGPRGLRGGGEAALRAAVVPVSPTRSSAPRSTSPRTRRATRPGRYCASTAGSPEGRRPAELGQLRAPPGTVTVSVSFPERITAPGVSPVNWPARTTSVPLTRTCSMPSASA